MKDRIGKVFVYGTLDSKEFFSDLVSKGEIRYLGKGRIKAKLYDLGGYPGAVESEECCVYGRVYEIKNVDKVLPLFDDYEEFYPEKPKSSLFIRKVLEVFMENGEVEKAYVYIYNGDLKGREEISKGFWEKL